MCCNRSAYIPVDICAYICTHTNTYTPAQNYRPNNRFDQHTHTLATTFTTIF